MDVVHAFAFHFRKNEEGARGEECDNARGRVRYTFHKRVNPCPGREGRSDMVEYARLITSRAGGNRRKETVENSITPSAKGFLSLSVNIHSFNFYDDAIHLILRSISHWGDWRFLSAYLHMDVNCSLHR